MKSQEAWRNATDGFSAAMEEAKSVIEQARGATGGPLQKFLLGLLQDAYRTGVVVHLLCKWGPTDGRIPADSVELLTRQILERAIVSSFARKYQSAEVVDRWRKTRALEWKEKWGESVDPDAENLPPKRLPDYRCMAEDVGGDLGKLYQEYGRLSFLIHPRLGPVHTVVEAMSRLSHRQFFCRRVEGVLRLATVLLIMLTGNFSESQSRGNPTSNILP